MEEYMGMVRIFGGDWAPPGWLLCNGQLLSTSQYNKLFRILGTTYGGNGTTNFALPNLQSVLPVGGGMGPAPDTREMKIAEVFGKETHTLAPNELATHNHYALVNNSNATQSAGNNGIMGSPGYMSADTPPVFKASSGYINATPNTVLHASTLGSTGGGKEHENRQPFVAMNYIICVDGPVPPRP